MNDSVMDCSVREFAARLSSAAPVPGGGGAAALIGALAAALCEMAGNLTVDKGKYAAVEADQKRLIAGAQALRERFLALVEEDAAAFEPLSRAYAMPKDAPDRASALTELTLAACRAPFQMLEGCCELIILLEEMLEKCSRLMLSDVGCGALAARAAMEAAWMNVLVNTRTLPENDEAAELERCGEAMLNAYLPRACAIVERVTETLGRKRNG